MDETPVEEITLDEPVIEDTPVEEITVGETVIEDTPVDDAFASVDTVIEDNNDISEDFTNEESPVEVSSVEENIEADTDDISLEQPVVEEAVIDDISETSVEENEINDDFEFDSVDTFADSSDETSEEVTEENPIEEDTEDIHNEPVDNYAEIDNLDNNVSKENIDYLTKDAESTQDVTMNSNLKQDIKSVLLYMDQLLENLPEDKIIEFAKSEEFTTYKKLFNELGLS